MTDEELDRARAEEAWQRCQNSEAVKAPRGSEEDYGVIAARLARTGWTPTNPLLLQAREIAAKWWEDHGPPWAAYQTREGNQDDSAVVQCALRGLELGRAGK